VTRREWAGAVAVAASARAATIRDAIVRRNDAAVEKYLATQVTGAQSEWRGAVPDAYGLYLAGSGGGVINTATAALVSPGSRYYRDARAMEALQLATGFLKRSQTPDGNISLETTNFNSPPDTGFVIWNVAEAASVARRHGNADIERLLQPFLMDASRGLLKGGVHTPNHRWVVSSALAQIHALWPDPAFPRRIDQWLAEGIDIDENGQFTERSTTIYNTVCDRALVLLATRLNRPELLEPVRRNLDSMMYLMHPGYEVVTGISRRQDLNQRGTMGRYWFPLAMLGQRDRNGQYWMLAKHFEAEYASLATMLDHPELGDAGPEPKPVPEDYRREFPSLGLARVRRGATSASVLWRGASRFFTLRRGDAVIEAVRFASAFFGKGQFAAQFFEKQGDSFVLRQDLEAGYYQPLATRVAPDAWGEARLKRAISEVCRLRQTAIVTETAAGFRLRIQSDGTSGVPLTIEIGLREGGALKGCEKIAEGAALLAEGEAVYEAGGHRIRFGPGLGRHRYVQVRGAEAKLPGHSVYLTGYTPFDHTIDFQLS
jgi:hypothetical protein